MLLPVFTPLSFAEASVNSKKKSKGKEESEPVTEMHGRSGALDPLQRNKDTAFVKVKATLKANSHSVILW